MDQALKKVSADIAVLQMEKAFVPKEEQMDSPLLEDEVICLSSEETDDGASSQYYSSCNCVQESGQDFDVSVLWVCNPTIYLAILCWSSSRIICIVTFISFERHWISSVSYWYGMMIFNKVEYLLDNFEVNRYYDMGKVELVHKHFTDLRAN